MAVIYNDKSPLENMHCCLVAPNRHRTGFAILGALGQLESVQMSDEWLIIMVHTCSY